MVLLELKNITKSFGKLKAVSELDLNVSQGEIHSIIGPNGAGKTTVFNLITGIFPATEGKIIFNGHDITGLEPHKIAQKGISRIFQQTFLFDYSTVLENVLLGFHMNSGAGFLKEFLHLRLAREMDRQCKEQALEIIEFMGLSTLKDELAGKLPHGHQRALGMSIALACSPTLLLLDEPVTGMNPTETSEMVGRIRKIREKGITIVLVEHDMKTVMGISDNITVLNYGKKIIQCLPNEIRQCKEVVEAYLGKEDAWDVL